MGKKLTQTVHVDGITYGPDDDVPAKVAERITNPSAWGESDDAEATVVPTPATDASDGDVAPKPAPKKKTTAQKSTGRKKNAARRRRSRASRQNKSGK